jgi:hypothetical protein
LKSELKTKCGGLALRTPYTLLFGILLLLFAADQSLFASQPEKPFPLPSDDVRVQEGKSAFEKTLAEKMKDLDTATAAFQTGLRMDMLVRFEDNQMDWKEYFYTEKFAFESGDAWTRAAVSEDRYENFYLTAILDAIDSRGKLITSFKAGTPDGRGYPDLDKKALLTEIEEAQYRVNTWSAERYRYRLMRAEKSWEDYLSNTMGFLKVYFQSKPELVESFEITLLESRLSVLLLQKEAMNLLKYEPEE